MFSRRLRITATWLTAFFVFVEGHSQPGISFIGTSSFPGAVADSLRGNGKPRSFSALPSNYGARIASANPVVMQYMEPRFQRAFLHGQKRHGQMRRCPRTVGEFKVDGIRTHYVRVDPPEGKRDTDIPPLILVHGFGANSQHFSRNMEEIAAATGAPVYAPDLIGFGNSEKPGSPVYGEMLWSRQIRKLVKDVVKTDKVFLAGNSIGGYVCMNVGADMQSSCAGLVLINSAGRHGDLNPLPFLSFLRWRPLATYLGKILFHQSRRPEHVHKTLHQVYFDKSKVDDELLDLILEPSRSPEADLAGPQLFYSLFTAPLGRSWDELLGPGPEGYRGPIMALWGKRDPWLFSDYVDILKRLRHDLKVRFLDAGHCPHHERHEEFNRYIASWMMEVVNDGTRML